LQPSFTAAEIEPTFFRVAQDCVSLGSLLEELLRMPVTRISVRMILQGQTTIPLLDLLFGSVSGYTQDFVTVAPVIHG
jgi:hypothetical protein